MKTLSFRFLILLALLSAPVFAKERPAQDEEVRAYLEKLIPAWNAHDMKTFASLFAPDADFVNVVGIWWKNRGEIEAAHVATHKTLFKDSRLTGQIASVKWIRPDVAAAHMTWSLVGAKSPNGDPIPERKGILLFVVAREATGWTIRAAQNTDIIEGVLAPPTPPGK